MSADKSHAARKSDRNAALPIGDLNAKPVDEKSADQARGGDGRTASQSDFAIVKTLDK